MLYDDRLGTVLRHRPGGAAAAKTQFRQLLDLLGTLPSEARGSVVDAAFLRLTELGSAIPTAERRLMLADPGLRLRSPRLVALLAQDSPAIAATAIARAQLSEQEWLDLVPALPVAARGFLRLRRDLGLELRDLLDALGIYDRGLPPAHAVVAQAREEPSPNQGIAALVKRIEAFRKARQPADPANDRNPAPRLPLGEEPFLRAPRKLCAFDFSCDPGGRIVWADPGVAPMIVGMSLPALEDREAGPLRQALDGLQPLRAIRVTLTGAPAIAGEWQIDAAPWFEPAAGRLAGWHGRFRRPPAAAAASLLAHSLEADRLRQLLHELRTPVNAIQGYAEAMQQGLFGPIGHEYRAMAAGIAADAARILGGFEELERLTRLESGAVELETGTCDLAQVVAATVARLAPYGLPRGSGFDLPPEHEPAPVPLAPIEAERIVWRLLAALAAASAPGERLALSLAAAEGKVALDAELPAALAAGSERDLFRAAATGSRLSAGNFGGGFALRLASAEARAAGGGLERRDNQLRLVLAGLTSAAMPHSHGLGLAGSPMVGPN